MQYRNLLVAITKAIDLGLLTFEVPLREFDYRQYYSEELLKECNYREFYDKEEVLQLSE